MDKNNKALKKDFAEYYLKYGFKDPEKYVYKEKAGLTKETVENISKMKKEPKWMRDFRLKALDTFLKKLMPSFGPSLSEIDFKKICYYLKPTEKGASKWNDVPETIRKTFERLGIPEAERKFLGGVGAVYESEVVYHKLRQDLEKKGVIFCSTDTALKEHEELFKKYFGSVVPPGDNKFAALNSAVWSGGSFIYVPKGVKVEIPLQAYFRINSPSMGQFERTLIIADEGSTVHYVEGCSAPIYTSESLHAAVVEIIAKKDAKVRYTTIQNWSTNVYNLVTKRAHAYEGAVVEWLDGNLGSRITMKYPSVYLMGPNSKAEILSIAFAGKNQNLDAGGKVLHLAPNTSSKILSKSISKDGGITTFRGLVRVKRGCTGVKSYTKCDALILDEKSKSDTIPSLQVDEKDVSVGHEATIGKISEEQLFYLMSRGLKEEEAVALIIKGFIAPFVKELPMEYAIELNRLVELEMGGAIA